MALEIGLIRVLLPSGDAATQRIYYEVPSEGTAFLTDVKNRDVRTEGMGYGMMAMLQMNNQTVSVTLCSRSLQLLDATVTVDVSYRDLT